MTQLKAVFMYSYIPSFYFFQTKLPLKLALPKENLDIDSKCNIWVLFSLSFWSDFPVSLYIKLSHLFYGLDNQFSYLLNPDYVFPLKSFRSGSLHNQPNYSSTNQIHFII